MYICFDYVTLKSSSVKPYKCNRFTVYVVVFALIKETVFDNSLLDCYLNFLPDIEHVSVELVVFYKYLVLVLFASLYNKGAFT